MAALIWSTMESKHIGTASAVVEPLLREKTANASEVVV